MWVFVFVTLVQLERENITPSTPKTPNAIAGEPQEAPPLQPFIHLFYKIYDRQTHKNYLYAAHLAKLKNFLCPAR